MLKKPEWKHVPGQSYPLDCAIWDWATTLIKHGKRGTHKTYLEDLAKHHSKEIIEQVKTLARERWRENNIGE